MPRKRAGHQAPRGAVVRPNGEVCLYGVIGSSWDGLDAETVMADIDKLGDVEQLVIRINSPGGLVFEGMAIFNHLVEHKAKIVVKIDGLAASMGSLIAMAGDEIIMGQGTMMMIHNPWSIAWGDARDLRKTADNLEKIRGQSAAIYAENSGQPITDVVDMMDEETWLTDEEAVDLGFATATSKPSDDEEDDADDEGASAKFDLSIFDNVPESAKRFHDPGQQNSFEDIGRVAAEAVEQPKRSDDMPKKTGTNGGSADDKSAGTTTTGQTTPTTQPAPEPAEQTAPPENEAETANAVVAADITRAVAAAELPVAFAVELIDEGVTLAQAQERIVARLVEGDDNGQSRSQLPRVVIVADEHDKFMEGVQLSLLAKAGYTRDIVDENGAVRQRGGEHNEFSSLTLREIARDCLENGGLRTRGMDVWDMLGEAFTYSPRNEAGGRHTRSDFAHILSNVAHLSMLRGYEEAGETFQMWTSAGFVSNFQPTERVDLNLFDNLDDIGEDGEYTYGTMGDRGVQVMLATYGKLFGIGRRAIINDDVGAFTRIPNKMGRAAIRTIGNLVILKLTKNDPLPGQTTPLFHADHGNLAETGGPPSSDSIDAMQTAMALQMDPDGKATGGLNITADYLIVPRTLRGTATVVVESEFDTDSGDKRLPNKVRNSVTVVPDARLDHVSKTEWYGAANPNTTDTIEVSYLGGRTEPRMESRDGFYRDGVEFKISMDAGVNALDYRGLFKNPG